MADEQNEQKQFKGNDTKAFNKHYLKIDVEADSEEELNMISRVEFVTGCIRKTYNNPKFPLFIDFTTEETQKLNYTNVGYLIGYDNEGRPEQCQGFINFIFHNGVIRGC